MYGTLRPDDNSGAAWTKDFNEDMLAERAELPGASLYIESYPAVCLEQTRCAVRGVLLTPVAGGALSADARFQEKLDEADRIEGHPSFYDRSVRLVRTASGDVKRAYVYHRTGRVDREQCTRILDGDWLSRPMPKD